MTTDPKPDDFADLREVLANYSEFTRNRDFQDEEFITLARNRLPALLAAHDAALADRDALRVLRAWVEQVARQRLIAELDDETAMVADFEGAYDAIVTEARALLTPTKENGTND